MATKPTATKITAEEMVTDFIGHLKREYQLPVTEAYLFGSHARGKAQSDSDVDVCVISPLFEREDSLSYLWTRRRISDVRNLIAPVGFSPQEFHASLPSPLVHEIHLYGKKIIV